jgi:hypothetical protein
LNSLHLVAFLVRDALTYSKCWITIRHHGHPFTSAWKESQVCT